MSSFKRKAGGNFPDSDAKKSKPNGSITSFFGQPKVVHTAAKAGAAAGSENGPEVAAPKFDKAKWVAKLTPEQKGLLKLEIETLDESWLAHLKDEVTSKEFLELKRFLDREANAGKKIFPPKEDVYSWSRHTPFHNVKVVILGQDPYHNHNQAHGLAFSVRPPTPAPPSLKNMYTCLKNDYPGFTPPANRGGLLTPWAERGVLLLNTCLTVRAHEANSHANRGWEKFTQRVIDLVAARRQRGVVFMAWGTPAGKRVARVDGAKHLVLKSVHPSPLSAARGFFTCRHFRTANEWLVKRYGPEGEIDWSLSPGTSTKAAAAAAAPAAAPAPAPAPVAAPALAPTAASSAPGSAVDAVDAEEEEALAAVLEEAEAEAGVGKKEAGKAVDTPAEAEKKVQIVDENTKPEETETEAEA